jgi:pyruvate kinase
MLRKTKIIATLGPATDTASSQRALIAAGVNVFRINMSHAPHDAVRRHARQIRTEAAGLETDVGILMDLQGPAIRTGDLAEPIALAPGDSVEIRQPSSDPKLPNSTTVNYPGLADDLRVGATVLVDNGVLQFRVVSKEADRITCSVLAGGLLGSRRHINLPGTRVNLPGLTEKDIACLDLAAEIGADFVAMSFVRDAAHVRQLRELLVQRSSAARIVSKIEDQSAVDHLDEIILASDAIMVARGDLGIEVPIEELPIIQRRIVSQCVFAGCKVIVATQMLESMISAPIPTRAEMTDVANAVFEKADAIMLSGETSVGKFPVLCVEILDRIARRAERASREEPIRTAFAEPRTDKQKIVRAAVNLANSLDEAKLLVFTQRGVMAEHTAHLRPEAAPIFAFAPSLEVARSLHLSRAVTPFVLQFHHDDPHSTIEAALAVLKQRNLTRAGDPVITISDVLVGEFVTDSVLLRRV